MEEKHPYNNFPNIQGNDYKKLKSDIQNNGYDSRFPIYLYEDKILDGWQRYQICKETGIEPIFKTFEGSNIEALQFMLRTNKRRNLTSSQWATVAAEAVDILNELKQQAKERQGMRTDLNKEHYNKNNIKSTTKGRFSEQAAKMFNTSGTYVRKAEKLKKDNPKEFETVKRGEKSLSQIHTKKQQTKPKDTTNLFFKETNDLLTRALDKVEQILQKDQIPKTPREFKQIEAINHNLYRAVRLAGQAGVNIKTVWDKTAARHGDKIETPKHLQNPHDSKNIEDAKIINH